eukprot:TRINITY_DN8769_c0_g1_i1.p1 TRINITY_DN8769_c0_g1~~TRINITY_DN8769_c0_g1_i1.p1  ORF type:complete len:607 (+),score=164.91 TRINITY_DN8769_c0_g1_i1:200-1822(+)
MVSAQSIGLTKRAAECGYRGGGPGQYERHMMARKEAQARPLPKPKDGDGQDATFQPSVTSKNVERSGEWHDRLHREFNPRCPPGGLPKPPGYDKPLPEDCTFRPRVNRGRAADSPRDADRLYGESARRRDLHQQRLDDEIRRARAEAQPHISRRAHLLRGAPPVFERLYSPRPHARRGEPEEKAEAPGPPPPDGPWDTAQGGPWADTTVPASAPRRAASPRAPPPPVPADAMLAAPVFEVPGAPAALQQPPPQPPPQAAPPQPPPPEEDGDDDSVAAGLAGPGRDINPSPQSQHWDRSSPRSADAGGDRRLAFLQAPIGARNAAERARLAARHPPPPFTPTLSATTRAIDSKVLAQRQPGSPAGGGWAARVELLYERARERDSRVSALRDRQHRVMNTMSALSARTSRGRWERSRSRSPAARRDRQPGQVSLRTRSTPPPRRSSSRERPQSPPPRPRNPPAPSPRTAGDPPAAPGTPPARRAEQPPLPTTPPARRAEQRPAAASPPSRAAASAVLSPQHSCRRISPRRSASQRSVSFQFV